MSISPTLFLERMTERWESFGNVVNAPLRLAWHQLCSTFNDKLRAADDPNEEETWKVLCPPTGSGKTQGLIVYASILNQTPEFHHPGMLIVTRLITDADKIATQINELSRAYAGNPELPDMAISYHSEKKRTVKVDDLKGFPILVITHKAYTAALDRLNQNAGIEDTWIYFYTFSGGSRRLVVIDEAIDLVDYSEIQLRDIENLLHFGKPIKDAFPFQWELLNCLKDIFADIGKRQHKHREMVLSDRPVWEWEPMIAAGLVERCRDADFTEFKRALRAVRMDGMISRNDPAENRRLQAWCLDTVSAVDSLFKAFIFYSRNQSSPTFNTARLLVPPSLRGGVILDATASCNVVYDLFNGATVIQPPPGTRKYHNVTLHVSYGHAVGKSDMAKKGLELSKSLVADFDERFSSEPGKKVLAVTHKAVEPFLTQCLPRNFKMSLAHWGAVDGSNEWQDHDAAVIFGLPYKPKRWAPSIFMAYQGVQESMWLHDPGMRKFRHHADIRKAIDTGQMVSDIIQAVNRISCRRVIDDEGNCPMTDIFILLSTPTEAKALLEGIGSEMPGINVVDLDYCHQKQGTRGRKVNRGNFDESLRAYLSSMNPGDRIAASRVRETLRVKPTTWDRIASRLKTEASDDTLCQELKTLGVTYQVEKRRAYFSRAAG